MIGLDWKDIELDWIKTSIDATKKKGRRKKKKGKERKRRKTPCCVWSWYMLNAISVSQMPKRRRPRLSALFLSSWFRYASRGRRVQMRKFAEMKWGVVCGNFYWDRRVMFVHRLLLCISLFFIFNSPLSACVRGVNCLFDAWILRKRSIAGEFACPCGCVGMLPVVYRHLRTLINITFLHIPDGCLQSAALHISH